MINTDLGKISCTPRGEWSETSTYDVLDIVEYQYAAYVAKTPVPMGTLPTNTGWWMKLVRDGDVGGYYKPESAGSEIRFVASRPDMPTVPNIAIPNGIKINDTTPSGTEVYSSEKIEEILTHPQYNNLVVYADLISPPDTYQASEKASDIRNFANGGGTVELHATIEGAEQVYGYEGYNNGAVFRRPYIDSELVERITIRVLENRSIVIERTPFSEYASVVKFTARGSAIAADNVSPVEHQVECKVESKNLIAPNQVAQLPEEPNFVRAFFPGGYYADEGYYTISSKVPYYVNVVNRDNNTNIVAYKLTPFSFYISKPTHIDFTVTIDGQADENKIDTMIANVQFEKGSVATPYTPYVPDLTTVTVSRYKGFGVKESDIIKDYILEGNSGILTPQIGTFTCKMIPIETDHDLFLFIPYQDGPSFIFMYSADGTFLRRTEPFMKSPAVATVNDLKGASFVRIRCQMEYKGPVYLVSQPTTYTPAPDGTVSGMTSLSPNMTILSDNPGVTINATYNVDTASAIDKVRSEIPYVPEYIDEHNTDPSAHEDIRRTLGTKADKVYVDNTFAGAVKDTLSGPAVATDMVSPVEHQVECKVERINYADVNTLSKTQTIQVTAPGAFTLTGTGYVHLNSHLRDLVPNLKANDKVTFTWTDDNNGAYKGRIYIEPPGDKLIFSGSPIVLTEALLDSYIAMYGDTSGAVNFSNFTVSKVATPYTPYVPDLSKVTVSRYGKNLYRAQDIKDVAVTVTGILKKGFQFFAVGNMVVSLETAPPNSTLYYKILHDGSYSRTIDINKTENKITAAKGDTIFIYGETIESFTQFGKIQIEYGNNRTEYEPCIKQDYTPTAEGIVEGMTSLSPNMTILSDTAGVNIEAKYNADTKKYIDKKFEALKENLTTLEGAVTNI